MRRRPLAQSSEVAHRRRTEATAARDGDDPPEEGGEESESGELQEWMGRAVGRPPRDADCPRRIGQHRRPGTNVTSSISYLVT